MKICTTLLLLVTILSFSQNMYKKVREIPRAYIFPRDSMGIVKPDVIPQQPWKVFSDRDNNSTYISPDPSASPSGKSLSFMEAVWVTDETDRYVRIARGNPRQLQLDASSEDLQWIEKSKMLLWTRSLSTNQSKITKKAMVINTFESLRNAVDNKLNIDKIKFKFAPYDGARNSGHISKLSEFYYILKREGKYVLLCRNERLFDSYEDRLGQVVGWAHESQLMFWDNRIAIEPNWESAARLERKTKRFYAIAVENEKEAKTIFDNKYSSTPLWKEDISTLLSRPDGEWVRFPLLETSNLQYQIHQIGILITNNDQSSVKDYLIRSGLSTNDLSYLHQNTYKVFIKGYVCMKASSLEHPLFKKVLFLPVEELYDIKSDFDLLGEGVSTREDFAKAWKYFIKKNIGDLSEIEMEQLFLSDWQEKIVGLPSSIPILKEIKISDIPNRIKFPDTEMKSVIATIKAKTVELNKIYRMSRSGESKYKYSFQSNGNVYYWIDEDLIP